MAFITWKDEYSVGNSEMDAQHQKLVAMINRMYEAMMSGKGKSEANGIVKEMIDYSKFHFEAEEKLMKQYHYIGFNDHIKEHKAFIAKAFDYEEQIKSGVFTISIELTNFLRDWLTNHILVNDKAYSMMFSK
jgi:hemerythrin